MLQTVSHRRSRDKNLSIQSLDVDCMAIDCRNILPMEGVTVKFNKLVWIISFVAVLILFVTLPMLYAPTRVTEFLNSTKNDELYAVTVYVADTATIQTFSHPSKSPETDEIDLLEPFTQGLSVLDYNRKSINVTSAILLETSGLYGLSFLRLLDVATGITIASLNLPNDYFAEGLCEFNGYIFMLTWKEYRLIVFRLPDNLSAELVKNRSASTHHDIDMKHLLSESESPFRFITQFKISNYGWGIATDGNLLWMTTGTDELLEFKIPWEAIRHQEALHERRSELPLTPLSVLPVLEPSTVVKLTCFGLPLSLVNELDYDTQRNTIWGNIFGNSIIVEFDSKTGRCKSLANFAAVYNPRNNTIKHHTDISNDVMNGVAMHPKMDTLEMFVTGKRWPNIYHVKLRDVTPNIVGKSISGIISYDAVNSWAAVNKVWQSFLQGGDI